MNIKHNTHNHSAERTLLLLHVWGYSCWGPNSFQKTPTPNFINDCIMYWQRRHFASSYVTKLNEKLDIFG